MYICLILNALAFLFALVLIIASVSFWTTQSYGLARMFDNILKVGRYPLDIFQGFLRTVLIYFLPLILIAQLPTQALLGAISPGFVVFAFTVSGVFLTAGLILWKIGLRNYMSAST
jgi:ABC-2 type transport system permease protein